MIKSAHNPQGFTLIELLVAVAIMAIVTAVTIPGFNSFIDSQNLKQAQEQVKNGLRDAQNKAITGVDSDDTCSAGDCTHWVLRFVDGSSKYDIGKKASGTDCTAFSSADLYSTSEKLHGTSTFYINGGGSSAGCVFYEMKSAKASTSGISSNRIRINQGASCAHVEVNAGGLIMGVTCP